MSEENKLIIEQINKFGRVPETSELLKMIEDLQNNWNELKEWLNPDAWEEGYLFLDTILEKMQELEGKNEKRKYICSI